MRPVRWSFAAATLFVATMWACSAEAQAETVPPAAAPVERPAVDPEADGPEPVASDTAETVVVESDGEPVVAEADGPEPVASDAAEPVVVESDAEPVVAESDAEPVAVEPDAAEVIDAEPVALDAGAAIALPPMLPSIEPPPRRPRGGALPWVLAGLGGAGLALGFTAGGVATQYNHDAIADPVHATSREAERTSQTYAMIANVALSTGALLAATGLVWGIAELVMDARDEGRGEGRARVTVRVSLAGLGLRGAF